MKNAMNNNTKDQTGIQKVKTKLKSTWGRLNENDLTLYDTKREQFMNRLKDEYGIAKKDAEKKIRAIEESCGCGSKAGSKAA